MTGCPARYRPPARYLRYRRRGSSTEMIAGLALGAVILSGATAGTLTVVHHHAAPHRARQAPVAVAPASGSETAFWRAFLSDLGAPATRANLASLDAWLPREEPWPSLATWNPLDSTQPMPGSTVFNSVGVQNYPTAAEGAQADALTLANGNYPSILAAFRSGTGVCGSAFAAEFGLWSGGGYFKVC